MHAKRICLVIILISILVSPVESKSVIIGFE